MMNIDIHWHVIPPEFLAEMRRDAVEGTAELEEGEHGPRIRKREVHAREEDFGAIFKANHDLDTMIRDMDRMELDMVAASSAPFLYYVASPPELALKVSRLVNDGIANMVGQRPDRMFGLAQVPWAAGAEATVAELERAVNDLGLKGASIPTNINGRNLDEPEYFSFFEKAADLDVPVFLHPINIVGIDRMPRYHLKNLVGNPTDTMIAAGSLIFGGVFERLPQLKVILAHAGGTLPYQIGRFDHGYKVRPEARVNIPRLPSEYFKLLNFDTLAHNTRSLQFLVEVAGADHVVIGTDHPYDMGDETPVSSVQEAALGHEAEQQVLGLNVRRLFGLDVSS